MSQDRAGSAFTVQERRRKLAAWVGLAVVNAALWWGLASWLRPQVAELGLVVGLTASLPAWICSFSLWTAGHAPWMGWFAKRLSRPMLWLSVLVPPLALAAFWLTFDGPSPLGGAVLNLSAGAALFTALFRASAQSRLDYVRALEAEQPQTMAQSIPVQQDSPPKTPALSPMTESERRQKLTAWGGLAVLNAAIWYGLGRPFLGNEYLDGGVVAAIFAVMPAGMVLYSLFLAEFSAFSAHLARRSLRPAVLQSFGFPALLSFGQWLMHKGAFGWGALVSFAGGCWFLGSFIRRYALARQDFLAAAQAAQVAEADLLEELPSEIEAELNPQPKPQHPPLVEKKRTL